MRHNGCGVTQLRLIASSMAQLPLIIFILFYIYHAGAPVTASGLLHSQYEFLVPNPQILALGSGRVCMHALTHLHTYTLTHTHTQQDRLWETDTVWKGKAIVKEISPKGSGWRISIMKVSVRTQGKRKKGFCAFVTADKNQLQFEGHQTTLATSQDHL